MSLIKVVTEKSYAVAELARKRTGNSLAAYIRAAWPLIEPKHPFVPGWHIDAIAEHLEAVKKRQIRNLIINIPPRHAKSTIVSVAFPSWVWTDEPEHKFIYGSHSYNLAKRDSIKTRNIIQSAWYKETYKINWKLAEDQNEKTNFLNDQGGFRRATSVLGAIIGEGGDTLIIDDPHSPRSVKSEVKRQTELDWIDEEFFTRLNDPKTVSKIVIMQRLDERDATAHLLAKKDWELLMLPAEYEPERKCVTVLGWEDPRSEKNEPLWKERFGTIEYDKIKADMGSKAWAGQGQQRPAPQDGIIFKREWFKFYKELPTEIDFYALSIDLPFDEGGSFAVFQVWARKGPNKYLLDQIRGQVGFTEQKMMFRSLCGKWPQLNAKWIEKKANGAAIIDELSKEFAGIIPINPQGSKETRAEAITPQFESGNVHLPDPSIAPWINDYIEELIVFNNGQFNDQVDATTQALLKLNVKSSDDWMPQSVTGRSKWI